ncbi:FMN-binding negative transcriptional regulator [Bryobacter aggregatus]|uniref:FMN-binding negative transcriptional regulator n=1 Tax=Bryobacter aggregatus TaxID=360054 RepID=UPI0004E11226|nr:FMN-binding negative transcriptional regulator [Bryobacter aggregatus]
MPERRNFLMALSALGVDATAAETADEKTIYIPGKQLESDRATILNFIEEFTFAMLVTAKGGVHITNVPTLFDRAAEGWGKVWWHIAKGNEQNQVFDGDTECTVVFHGPHGYISPNWYATKNAVPTWNFAVVHATGKPKRIDDDTAFAKSLERLVAQNERHYGGGDTWDYAKLPDSYLKGMRQGIVAYQMEIEKVEAKFKLGHERSAADRAGVLEGLKSGPKERNLTEFTEAYYAKIKA